MSASILKQDPNTKRFKRTLIYFDNDTVCKFLGKSPLWLFYVWLDKGDFPPNLHTVCRCQNK